MRKSMTSRPIARTAAVAAAIALAMLATGCIHVSQRALDNGRAMQMSNGYQDVMTGNVNPRTLRSLYYSSNGYSLAFGSTRRFAPFTHW
jgi:hypothetical protein